MLKFRLRYIYNFLVSVLMIVASGYFSAITYFNSYANDDSLVSWSGGCKVEDQFSTDGAVGIRCPHSDNAIGLHTDNSSVIATVGNIRISDRGAINTTCESYESGRWTCQFEGNDLPIRVYPN